MDVKIFDYALPKKLIANSPASPRDHSRLMAIDQKKGEISNHIFYEIEKYLGKNDVLVLNKTKVFPARFYGQKDTGGKIEILLIEELKDGVWKALTKPGLKENHSIIFRGNVFKKIGQDEQASLLKTDLSHNEIFSMLLKYGRTPLPPYISSKNSEVSLRKKYQTVYAERFGSVAAPTAGFHFTKRLLAKLKKKGVQIEYVTLHVGLGTFAPVKTKTLEEHKMHSEYFEVENAVYKRLNEAKKSGKRIVAVGTTSTRVLESFPKKKGYTKIFIYPGYKFKFVDALITNFHLPKSTLLALVYTLGGTKLMKKAYKKAIKEKYRFYSFGDACFIF
jgi:S-adenosylmethionine:tRNA ribosyltransferase-isomerase